MKLNIIYLDDEPELCEIFQDLFTEPHLNIQTFCDPEVAIKEIQKKTPDLLFIDYRLPNTNGEKIAKSLNLQIPVILITGDLNLKPEYPFTYMLKKPYDPADVIKIIAEYSTIPSKTG